MDNMKTLYFDFQATTPVADEVLSKMQPYFSEFFANPHASDHVLGWKSDASVENAAQQVARLIGADGNEIIFTSGATESNNLAILGLARRAALAQDRKSTRLNSSHVAISYAVFCLKKKKKNHNKYSVRYSII